MPEQFPHFVRIDRDGWRAAAHYVVHTRDPRFTLELSPDPEAPDRIGQGIIKRIHVPNSWAGDYGRYGRLLQAAQEFFVQSNPSGQPSSRR